MALSGHWRGRGAHLPDTAQEGALQPPQFPSPSYQWSTHANAHHSEQYNDVQQLRAVCCTMLLTLSLMRRSSNWRLASSFWLRALSLKRSSFDSEPPIWSCGPVTDAALAAKDTAVGRGAAVPFGCWPAASRSELLPEEYPSSTGSRPGAGSAVPCPFPSADPFSLTGTAALAAAAPPLSPSPAAVSWVVGMCRIHPVEGPTGPAICGGCSVACVRPHERKLSCCTCRGCVMAQATCRNKLCDTIERQAPQRLSCRLDRSDDHNRLINASLG